MMFVIVGNVEWDEDVKSWFVGRILWEDDKGALVENVDYPLVRRAVSKHEIAARSTDNDLLVRRLARAKAAVEEFWPSYLDELGKAGRVRKEFRSVLAKTLRSPA